jgi:hypothetical protein
MKTLIILILSCASVFGADTSIQVITTTNKYTQNAEMSTVEVFTRDGQTNLVRSTATEAGVVRLRMQQIYHGGVPVVGFTFMKDSSSGIVTEAGIPYQLIYGLGPSNELRSVVFATNHIVLDAFTCTNGVLYPVESKEIQQFNMFF